jgi:hypothetical protein
MCRSFEVTRRKSSGFEGAERGHPNSASGTEQTNRASDYKVSLMPKFVFQIRNGQYANDHTIELPNADAARLEASSMCVDRMRDIMTELETNPEWRMEV